MGTKKRKEREIERKLSKREVSRRKAKKNRLVIISVVVMAIIIIGVSIYFAVSGGGGSTSTPATTEQPSGLIKATWIEPQVDSNTVSIPVSEIESNKIIHFELSTSHGDIAFMAYELGGEVYIRANACPPCPSVSFSLQRDILVCDNCQTTFKAKTGDGINGSCVNYPKASVPYEITDGNIIMSEADLIAAHQDTL